MYRGVHSYRRPECVHLEQVDAGVIEPGCRPFGIRGIATEKAGERRCTSKIAPIDWNSGQRYRPSQFWKSVDTPPYFGGCIGVSGIAVPDDSDLLREVYTHLQRRVIGILHWYWASRPEIGVGGLHRSVPLFLLGRPSLDPTRFYRTHTPGR